MLRIGSKRKYGRTATGRPKKRQRMSAADFAAFQQMARPSSRYLNRRGAASKETGYVDLANAAYAADTTGTLTLIATIAQGAAVTQRVGKKIVFKSIQIRGNAANGSTATLNDVALIIVYDRRPTGSLPTIGEVLVSASSNAFNLDANSGRFKILRRYDCCLSGNSATPATGNEIKDMTDYITLKDLPCVFKAAGTGAIGDIEQGALYAITVGNVGAGTAAAAFNVGYRTRFVDI